MLHLATISRILCRLVLGLATIAGTTLPSPTLAGTILSTALGNDRGTFNSSAFKDFPLFGPGTWKAPEGTYFVRGLGSGDANPNEAQRSYHIFGIPDLAPGQSIGAATLRLTHPTGSFSSPNPQETVSFFEVATDVSILRNPDESQPNSVLDAIFDDLGSGTEFATFIATPSSDGSVEEILLNAAALTALNASLGEEWAVGAALTSIGETGFGVEEQVFKRSETIPDVASELVLTIVPEPSTALLFSLGLIGLSRVGRRERNRQALRRGLLVALTAIPVFSGAAQVARAETIALDLVADPTGRWFDFFSDAFAQVDGGPLFGGGPDFADGFYLISSLPSFAPIGSGVQVFPFGSEFGEVGNLTIDASAVSGSGVETAPITAIDIEFSDFIADDDAITNGPYVTSFSNVIGTVTFVDGQASSVELTSTVRFEYDFSGFGEGILPFEGIFDIDESGFDLFVDPPGFPSPFGTVRFRWDVTGTATPVPEPSVHFALTSGVLLVALLGPPRRSRERGRRCVNGDSDLPDDRRMPDAEGRPRS